ncbi:MAG: flagellar M-ring protein FliF [Bdellovibrionales bacterium]|nr:flagellar M-ring protein FliF [Bdellovibrionales bacterium]
MNEYFKKVGRQIYDFMTGLSPMKKLAMVTTGIAIGGILFALFRWAGETAYRPLMTNLAPEDATNIIRILRERKIPFNVDPTGRNIEVPPERIYDLRLELATQGLPESGNVGYEVFDKQALGTTSFVQNVNLKRALEGELTRTIQTIKGVKRARVHLAMPKKSTFVEDQKEPTASVVLDLEPGTQLGEKQVYGIGVMVSSAVEGLDHSAVRIVDSNGKMLSKGSRDSMVSMSADQQEYKAKLEEDLQRRVEEMLGRVVGDGRVVARVTAEMDFSQVTETQTLYDADGAAVRSVQKNQEEMQGRRPGAMGSAGAASNLPGQNPATATEIRSDTNKVREITNYEVPQTVRKVVKPFGSVSKLSVAVIVDGKHTKEQKDGEVLSKVEPWSPEKLKEFETMIAGALGVDPKRGDKVEIRHMEFASEDFDEAARLLEQTERRAYMQNLLLYSVIGVIIVLFFFFVVRPYIKWVTENTIDSVDSFLPQTIEELERMQKDSPLVGLEDSMPSIPEKIDPEKVEGEMIKEKVITLVDSNPHKAALILRDWVKGEKPAAAPAADKQGTA